MLIHVLSVIELRNMYIRCFVRICSCYREWKIVYKWEVGSLLEWVAHLWIML